MRKRPSDGEGETSSRERCPEVMNLLLELGAAVQFTNEVPDQLDFSTGAQVIQQAELAALDINFEQIHGARVDVHLTERSRSAAPPLK